MNWKLAVVLAGLAAVAALLGGLATAGAADHGDGVAIFREIHVSLQCEGPSPVAGTAVVVIFTDATNGVATGQSLACNDETMRFDSYVGMEPGGGPIPGTFSWEVLLFVTDSGTNTAGPMLFTGVGSGFARLAVDNIAVNFEIAGAGPGPAAPCDPVVCVCGPNPSSSCED